MMRATTSLEMNKNLEKKYHTVIQICFCCPHHDAQSRDKFAYQAIERRN